MFSTLGYYICIPFSWLLRVFYNMTGSYGVAIILFTIVIKLIMLPFQLKSKKSMIRMNRMSGKMQEIKNKYANNPARANEEIQKIYQEEGINPTEGCLWTFLPLPILMALYSIIRQPITHFMMLSQTTLSGLVDKVAATGVDISNIVQMKEGVIQMKDGLYQLQAYGQINLINIINSQLPEIGSATPSWIDVNYQFLGMNLTTTPGNAIKAFSFSLPVIGLILIPILAGLFQLIMSIYMMKHQPQNNPGASSMKSMMYVMPLMSIYIAFIMPAALGVYWIAQSVFSLIQEILMTNIFNKKIEEEENAKYEARQAERQKRQEEARRLQAEHKQQQAEQQKQSLKEKQKAAQAAKLAKAAKAGTQTTEAGRVGNRPYARGRAYKADRYDN